MTTFILYGSEQVNDPVRILAAVYSDVRQAVIIAAKYAKCGVSIVRIVAVSGNPIVISNGIKIRTQSGSPVKSVEKGTVIFADDFRSYGQTVIIDHGGDLYTIYGLLGSIMVQEGQKIESGRVIGNAGAETQPQVYFEVRTDGHPVNPLTWLK